MNYEKIYNNFILKKKQLNREKTKNGVYYEKHHIIPRSLGGDNKKENLVLLTAKEHFFAHLLLIEFCIGFDKYKMISALFIMLGKNNNLPKTSKVYERIRHLYIKSKIGSKLSKATIAKRTAARLKNNKGIYNITIPLAFFAKKSNETIDKRNATRKKNKSWNKNPKPPQSEEAKNKISSSLKGRRPSQKTINASIKKKQKAVIQYDLNRNFIREWDSISEAAKALNLSGIAGCCNGQYKRTGNFTFQFKNPEHKVVIRTTNKK